MFPIEKLPFDGDAFELVFGSLSNGSRFNLLFRRPEYLLSFLCFDIVVAFTFRKFAMSFLFVHSMLPILLSYKTTN